MVMATANRKGVRAQMVTQSAKVFGYVDKSLKARIARLKDMDTRLSESRLVDEGLRKIVEYYEAQVRPSEPAQQPTRNP